MFPGAEFLSGSALVSGMHLKDVEGDLLQMDCINPAAFGFPYEPPNDR